jgi:hypothetical protein
MHFAYNQLVIWKHRFWTEVNMSFSKRLKRLWVLLTTEEVFHPDGTSERRTVRRPPRG